MNKSNSTSMCFWADDDASKVDAVLFLIIFIAAFIGNIIVFVCYARFRLLRSVTNVFIVFLSASDLLVACVSVPFSYAILVCGFTPKLKDEYFDGLMYKISDMLPSVLSIYSLTLVAMDRAIAIKYPFMHRKFVTRRVAWMAVAVACILALAFVSLVFAAEARHFTIFIVFVAYALPVSIMVICYTVIGIVAKGHAKELSSLERTATRLRCESNASSQDPATSCPFARSSSVKRSRSSTKSSLYSNGSTSAIDTNGIDEQALHKRRLRNWRYNNFFNRSLGRISGLSHERFIKREVKGAMTLALILGCFILSWTPFIAINIQFSICPSCPLNVMVLKYFKVLHYSNSAVNPVLYILLNRQWRAAFKSTVCCESKQKQCDSKTRLYSW